MGYKKICATSRLVAIKRISLECPQAAIFTYASKTLFVCFCCCVVFARKWNQSDTDIAAWTEATQKYQNNQNVYLFQQ